MKKKLTVLLLALGLTFTLSPTIASAHTYWGEVVSTRTYSGSHSLPSSFDYDYKPMHNGRYYDLHEFWELRPGDTLVVDVDSMDFDTYIELQDSNGVVLAYNDNYVGTNSHIEYRIPNTNPYSAQYYLKVTTRNKGETGDYEIHYRKY